MVKSTRRIASHLGGIKGNLLAQRLKAVDLEKVMVVPIEVGKSYHKALLADYFGSIMKEPFEFHSSQEGISFLDHTISKVSREQRIEEVFLALEATGHYYQRPAASIHRLGYRHLFVLNPLSTAQCRKAGLSWSKTDDIDLRAIGQALLCGYGTLYRPEQPLWEDLRQLCRYRRFQVKYQTALKNKVHVQLDHLLPGITELKMFQDEHLWHPAALAFFTKYPNVQLVSGLRPDRVVEFFRRRGRRLSPEEAHQLMRWSRQAFAQRAVAQETREQIQKSLLVQLGQISECIGRLEIELLGYLVRLPAVLLLSIDHIGPIWAGELAGEITPWEQYPHSRALIKAAGLDVTRWQSAARESSDHSVSYKGSRKLRYISIDIGDALMRHNAYFAFFAKRLMERGKSPGCACIATTTRFLRVAFWMVKNQQPFQPANGLGVSPDPLTKIELFLTKHQASDRVEEYVQLARRYFDHPQPKQVN